MKDNLKQKFNQTDIGELNAGEVDLILNLRHEFRFGEVEVSVRDGIPQQILKTVKRKKMGLFEVMHSPVLQKQYPELYNKLS